MVEPALASFGFKKSKKAGQSLGINVAEDGPSKVSLSTVERDGIFRTADGQNADLVNKEGKKLFVIPRIENTYKAGSAGASMSNKFTPSFKPPSSDAPVGGQGDDRFEMAAPAAAPAVPQQYGLQQVQRKEKLPGQEEAEGDRSGLGGSITERLTAAKTEERAYQRHVEELPDMAPVEAYESMPIEEFGMAMLRGMGWSEGMGVGRNRTVVEAIEYLKRPERLGLGAQAVMQAPKLKQRKMGDAPETVRREEMVLAPDADGRQRHVRKLDEKLVRREELRPGPRAGKEMAVVSGRHEGLRCLVVEVLSKEEGRSERCRVKLRPSNEEAQVRSLDLADLADLALERRQKQLDMQQGGSGQEVGRNGGRAGGSGQGNGGGKDERDRERDSSGNGVEGLKSRERDRDGGEGGGDGELGQGDGKRERSSSKRKSGRREEEEAAPKPTVKLWLFPHIKVRVIDKRLQGGRLYLKKGEVADVHPGSLADVSMDEDGQVLQLPQSSLETVLPKEEGSSIMVVAGPLRGSRGRLLKRSADEGVVAVQISADFSVHRLLMDDVAMYTARRDEDDD